MHTVPKCVPVSLPPVEYVIHMWRYYNHVKFQPAESKVSTSDSQTSLESLVCPFFQLLKPKLLQLPSVLFLHFSVTDLSANPINSTFKVYSISTHLLSPPLTPWIKAPFHLAWTIEITSKCFFLVLFRFNQSTVFRKQYQIHSKLEQKVQRIPMYFCPHFSFLFLSLHNVSFF